MNKNLGVPLVGLFVLLYLVLASSNVQAQCTISNSTAVSAQTATNSFGQSFRAICSGNVFSASVTISSIANNVDGVISNAEVSIWSGDDGTQGGSQIGSTLTGVSITAGVNIFDLSGQGISLVNGNDYTLIIDDNSDGDNILYFSDNADPYGVGTNTEWVDGVAVGGSDIDFSVDICSPPTLSAISVADECLGTDVTVDLTGLADGDYDIVYNVLGTNTITSMTATSVNISASAGSFNIANGGLTNTGGSNTVTVTKVIENATGCEQFGLSITDTFIVEAIPVVSGLAVGVSDECLGDDATASITGSLATGLYTITYDITTGPNAASGMTATANITGGGAGTFIVPAANLASTGTTDVLVITDIESQSGENCSVSLSESSPAFSVEPLPITGGMTVSIPSAVCEDVDATVTIGGGALADGDYIITYDITGGSNDATGLTSTTTISGGGGAGSFTVPGSILANSGTTNDLTVTDVAYATGQECAVSGVNEATGNFAVEAKPDVSSLAVSIPDPVCEDVSATATISGNLADDTYTITFNISGGVNNATGLTSTAVTTGGGGTFTISGDDLHTAGPGNVVTITEVQSTSGTMCSVAGLTVSSSTFVTEAAPDISGLGVSVSDECLGNDATASITGSLETGLYTITYDIITGPNAASGMTATANITGGGSGTFTVLAANLSSPGTTDELEITDIESQSGENCSVSLSESSAAFSIEPLPITGGMGVSMPSDVCQDADATATITGSLTDGDYLITYNITGGSNAVAGLTVTVSVTGGTGGGTFIVPGVSLINAESNGLTITDVAHTTGQQCAVNGVGVSTSGTFTVEAKPDVSSLAVSIDSYVGVSTDATASITSGGLLADGSYIVTYDITGGNATTDETSTATISGGGGVGAFTITAAELGSVSSTNTIIITDVQAQTGQNCTSSGLSVTSANFEVAAYPTIVSAAFFDTDTPPDGKIDEMVIELNENIDESSVDALDFDLSGGTGTVGVFSSYGSGNVGNNSDTGAGDEFATFEVSGINTTAITGIMATFTNGGNDGFKSLTTGLPAVDNGNITEIDKAGPAFVDGSISVQSGNAYVTMTFSEGIYASDLSSAIDFSDLITTNFSNGGGGATSVSITAVTDELDNTLSSNAVVLRAVLDVGGTVDNNGDDVFDIKPLDGMSIYDAAGNAMRSSEITDPTLNLNFIDPGNVPVFISALPNSDNSIIRITFSVIVDRDGDGGPKVLEYKSDKALFTKSYNDQGNGTTFSVPTPDGGNNKQDLDEVNGSDDQDDEWELDITVSANAIGNETFVLFTTADNKIKKSEDPGQGIGMLGTPTNDYTVTLADTYPDGFDDAGSSAIAYDTDGDGNIDEVAVILGDNVDDSTLDITSFSFDGVQPNSIISAPANATDNTPVADDNIFTLGFNTFVGTAVTGDLVFTQGTLRDDAASSSYDGTQGNLIQSGTLTPSDAAEPVIKNSFINSSNAYFELEFSEEVRKVAGGDFLTSDFQININNSAATVSVTDVRDEAGDPVSSSDILRFILGVAPNALSPDGTESVEISTDGSTVEDLADILLDASEAASNTLTFNDQQVTVVSADYTILAADQGYIEFTFSEGMFSEDGGGRAPRIANSVGGLITVNSWTNGTADCDEDDICFTYAANGSSATIDDAQNTDIEWKAGDDGSGGAGDAGKTISYNTNDASNITNYNGTKYRLYLNDINNGPFDGRETYTLAPADGGVSGRSTGGPMLDTYEYVFTMPDLVADDIANATVTTFDVDGDGDIDEVAVQMQDSVTDSSIIFGEFDIDGNVAIGVVGSPSNSVDPGNPNDQIFTLLFDISGTAATGSLDYNGSTLKDDGFSGGNSTATGSVATIDGAGPVITSAITADNDLNGKIDEIAIEFSETIVSLGLDENDFTLDGGSYTANAISIGASTATLTLDEIAGGGVYDTDATPTVTIVADVVEDLAGANNPAQAFGAADDGAAPYVTVTQIVSTSDATPDLGGIVDDPNATILVSVGTDFGLFATNNMDGTWTLPGTSITPLNPGGPYQVVLSTFDTFANVGTDAQTNDIVSVTGGVVISEPSSEIICIGEEVVLDNITLTETNSTDFASGGTFILSLPAGFEYNTGAIVTVTDNGGDVDVDANPVQYNGTTNFSIQLDNDNSDDDSDIITIIGLTVKAVGAVAANSEVISISGTAGYSTGQSQIGELSSLEVEDAITDVDVDGSTVTEYATSYTGTLVVNYNNAHGPTFTDGEEFTFSGGSVGEMVPGTDNGSSMTVFLTTGTTIGVNESLTGGLSGNTSTVSVATTAGTPYLVPFTITVNEGGYDAEWYDDSGSPIVIASGGGTTTNVELGATSPGLYSYDITIDNGTCENQPFRFNVLIYDDTDGDDVDSFYDRNFISDNPAVTLNLSNPTGHTILIYGDGVTVTNPTTDPIVVTFDPALAFDPNVQTTVNEITYSVTNDITGEQVVETVDFTVDLPSQIFTNGNLPLDMCASEFPRSFDLSTSLPGAQVLNYIYFRNATFGGNSEFWYRFASEITTYTGGAYTFNLNPTAANTETFTSWPSFNGFGGIDVPDGSGAALYVERGLSNPGGFNQENIFVYGDPIVELSNVADVYCGDDAPFALQRTATYATGFDGDSSNPTAIYKPIVESETAEISTGYVLFKADPEVVPAKGGPYAAAFTPYTSGPVVLADGEYDFSLFDSFGDGIYAPYTFEVVDADLAVIFSLTALGNPSFSLLEENFCIGTDPGCFKSPITVNLTTDNYPSETTWDITAASTYSFYADFTSSMTSTFNPSDPNQNGLDYTVEDESGDYRIVYTSEGLTPTGTCTGSTFFDVTINSIPEIGRLLSPLETGNTSPFVNYNNYPSFIGDVWQETSTNDTDYNGNDAFFVEYYGVNAVTSTGYFLTNETQSRYNWYREDLTPIIENGNWFLQFNQAYDNPATPAIEGPEAGKTYDFYFARVADGCVGELRKFTVNIYNETASPQLDATWVSGLDAQVSNAFEIETNHYQVEYCDTFLDIELEDPDDSGSIPASRKPDAYYKIYGANPDGSQNTSVVLDDYHTTGTLNASDLGIAPGTTTLTVYVSQVWNDQTPGSTATAELPYEGGEGPATRLDITVYGSPSVPTLAGDFPTLETLDLQICEGEVFTSFVNTATDIDEYIWYAPDMSTEIKRVPGGSTLNAIDLQPTIYYDKDVPAEYEFYVSRISNRNADTGFSGCESGLTRVTISVHPIADEAIVSSVDYADEEVDPIDVTYSVCILDYSVSDVLAASSTYSSAPFPGDEKVFLWYSANSGGVNSSLLYTGEMPTFGDLGMSDITAATTRYFNVVQRTDNSFFADMVGCDSPPAFVTVNFKVAEDFYFKSEVTPAVEYDLYNSGDQFCHDESYFDLAPSFSTSTSDADFIESNSYTYTLYEGGTNTIVEVASTPITGNGPLTMSLDAFHYASGGTDTGGSSTDFDLEIDYFDPIAECTRTKVFSFTINPQPVATFLIKGQDYENDPAYPDPIEVCYDDGVLDLEGVLPITLDPLANLSGNLFDSPSGAIGNLGNNKANFVIATAHPDPFAPEDSYDVTFTYTDLLGCDITLSKTIIVKPRPKPSGTEDVNQIQFTQICKESDAVSDSENEIAALIEMLDPADGASPISDYTNYTFDWTVNGSLVGSMSNTNSISFEESANNLNFSVVVTNPEGCQVTVVESHIKQDLPNLNIDGIGPGQQFCSSDSDVILTLKDGVVDAASSTITWTVDSYNTGAGTISTAQIFSGSGSNPTIDIDAWHVAAGGNSPTMGDIVGGPSTVHTITMTYQDNTRDYQGAFTQCSNIIERTITINPLPDISFDVEFLNELEGGYTETFCYDYGLISLQGIFADGSDLTGGSGSFSGPGVIPTGNSLATWNPEAAHGSDPHKVQTGYDITFTYTDPNGCIYAVTKTLNVDPLPDPVEFGPGNDQIQFSQICSESPIVAFVELDGISDYSNYTFDWDLPGDAIGNSSTVDNMVTYESAITNDAADHNFDISVTITNIVTGCSIQIDENHDQQELPELSFTKISDGGTFCQEESDLTLALSTDTGLITGSDLDNMSFSVTSSFAVNTVTTNSFTGEDANPVIDFQQWHLDAGGTVTGGTATTHTITVTYQDLSFNTYQGLNTNCTNTVSATITIYPDPDLSFTVKSVDIFDAGFVGTNGDDSSDEFCYDSGLIDLDGAFGTLTDGRGYTLEFGNGSFSSTTTPAAIIPTGANNNALFDPAIAHGTPHAARSTHTIRFTYNDEFGCENFVEKDIYVNPLPDPIEVAGGPQGGDQIKFFEICEESQIVAYVDLGIGDYSNYTFEWDLPNDATGITDYSGSRTPDMSGIVSVTGDVTANSITFSSDTRNFTISVTVTQGTATPGCGFTIIEDHEQQLLPELDFDFIEDNDEYCTDFGSFTTILTDGGSPVPAGDIVSWSVDSYNSANSATAQIASGGGTNVEIDFLGIPGSTMGWHELAGGNAPVNYDTDNNGSPDEYRIIGGPSTVHTITVEYKDKSREYQENESQCINTISRTITMHPRADISFTVNDVDINSSTFEGIAGDDSGDEFCYDDDLVDLVGAFGTDTDGDVFAGGGTFSGPGVVPTGNNLATFNPAVAHPSEHAPRAAYTIQYTYSDINACEHVIYKDIHVNPLPDPIEVTGSDDPAEDGAQIKFQDICEGSPITAFVELDGISDYSDYTFDWDLPNDATDIQDANGNSIILNRGLASVSGMSNGNFITYSSASIVFTIDVTITKGISGCSYFISEDHVQQPLPDLNFTLITDGEEFCQEDVDLELALSTNTGIIAGSDLANLSYSVVGSSVASSATFTDSGTGNPVIDFMTWHLGAGGSEVGGEFTSHTITMTYQDLSFDQYQGNFNNCTSTTDITIKIYPRPTLSYTYEQQGTSADEEVCVDEGRLTLRSSLAEESGITVATFSVSDFTPTPAALEDNNDGTADINIERLFLDAINAGMLDDSGATATRSSRSITVDIDLFYETEFLCTNLIAQSVTIHNLPVPEYDITQNGSSLVVAGVVEVCIDDISDADAAIADRILLTDVTNQVVQGSRTSASFVENNYELGATSLENVGTSGQAYFYPRAAIQVAEAANPTLVTATSIDFIFDMSYTNEFGCTGSTLASDAEAGVVDYDNRMIIRVYRTPEPTIKVDVAGFSRDESDYCIDHDIDADPIRLFVEDITFDTGTGSGGTFVSDPPLSAAALYGAIVNGSGFDEIYFNPEEAYAEHPTANTDNGDVATFEITYIYSTSDKACANVPSESTIEITVNPKPFVEFIVDQGVGTANNEFCIDDEVLPIRGFAFTELSQTTDISDLGQGDFATNITGSPGVTKNVNNIYDVNFTNAYNANGGTRTHTVTYTYVNNETGCYNSATQDIIINTKPIVDIDAIGGCDKLPVEFTFTTLETAPEDGIASVLWDFDDFLAEDDNDPNTFNSSTDFAPIKTYSEAGEYFPSLVATSDKGCTSVEVTRNVQIGDIPDVNFTVEGICDDSEFTFVASPTSVSFGTVKSISFDYDDGSDPVFIDTQGNPDNFTLKHSYIDPGVYDVQLILTTNNDCIEIHERKVAVQPTAVAPYFEDFDAAVPQTRDFTEWSYDPGTEIRSTTGGSESGVVIEAAGWSVDFRPLDDKEQTDNGDGDWGKLPSDFNTWQFGVPSGVLINNDTNHGNVWATNLDGNYNSNEVLSWIYTPCFDISALERPMVSFDKIYHFVDQRDGVVLQYSVDGGLTWLVLGSIENGDATGMEWYTHADISGFPGQQFENEGGSARDYGWASNLDPDANTNLAEWTSSRHKLDEIEIGDKGVIFRFALGTNPSDESEGFALDNFRVDERVKNVLLEQFSNTNTDDSRTVTEDINDILGDISQNNDDIISINYHTSFAGELDVYDGSTNPPILTNPDPISILNTEDPSARSAYYGIADAPASVLDGQFELGDPEAEETVIPWTRNDIARSSLEDALFDIVISDNFGSDPMVLEVDVTATAQADIGDGTARELALYIAIIEKDVELIGASNAERTSINALRKMLPSGIGLREEKEFLSGVSIQTTQSWDITNNVDASDLAIVVFVQDVESKTIYQTVMKDVVGKTSPTITGIDNTLNGEDYSLYPNPANQEVFVVFEKTTIEVMHWSIYDQTGKVYKFGKLKPGAEGFSLETRHFPAGMYFISLNGENLKFRNKKLMITH
ncbi:MAG: T9SS type A sorting domain-containing protein [Cyclobacteriaceae bacterium]